MERQPARGELGGEPRPRVGGGLDLERAEQAQGAHEGAHAEPRGDGVELAPEHGAQARGVLEQALVLVDLQGLERRGARERVRVVREAAREDLLVEVLRDALVHDDGADRRVAGGQALGGGDDVGHDVPVLEAERLAGAAEAGEDLVGDEQRALGVARAADERPVLGRGHEHAVGAGDGLEDDGGHRARALERHGGADVGGALAAAGLDALAERAAIAVAVLDVDDAGEAGLDERAAPVAGERDRAHRRAVVAAVAADELLAPGDLARDLERVLVGLGAAEREEDLGEAGAGHGEEALGEARSWRVHGVRRREAELVGLALDGLDDAAVAVADVDLVAERAEVEPAAAVGGGEPGALAAGELDGLARAAGRSR